MTKETKCGRGICAIGVGVRVGVDGCHFDLACERLHAGQALNSSPLPKPQHPTQNPKPETLKAHTALPDGH
jgi:hypothetical protein